MRIALVSDAWTPQVNGVVRTIVTTIGLLRAQGHTVDAITPNGFRSIACPSYPEIRLAVGAGRPVARRLDGFAPDAVHIATEGPLGLAARRWCLDRGMAFTTAFHTRFPEYLAVRTGLQPRWFWPMIRRFHASAERVFVSTPTLAAELRVNGLPRTHLWSRGVDLTLFSPDSTPLEEMASLPRPVQLYVGRLAVEKNIGAFLAIPTVGTKVLVGDGPARASLQRAHPEAVFLGPLIGAALASAYASADVFVFPSRTDTFGLVMIEALATGIPVAAFPVPGPLDILGPTGCGTGERRIGAVDQDLSAAIRGAIRGDRNACVAEAQRYGWPASVDQFLAGLAHRNVALRSVA